MMDTVAVSGILDALYDAALCPERTPDALRKLGDAFGCEHVALIDRQVDTLQGRVITTGFDAGSQREFLDVWSAHDILRLRTRHWRPGAIETDQHIVPRSEFLASDFYNGFLKPRDLHAAMRLTLGYEGKVRRAITLLRPRSGGDFDADAMAQCQPLMPHLQRASQIGFRAANVHTMLGALSDVVDRSSAAVLLLDGTGMVKFANRSAQAIAATGDAILLRDNRLEALDRKDDAALQRLIAAATVRLPDTLAERGGVIRLARSSGKASYIVTVAPTARDVSWAGNEPMAQVSIADPDASPAPPGEILKQLFGFSAAEIRVAERLMMGESPERAAAFLEVTVGTARWHLASMYRKTGTKRQAELVRLLLSLAMM